MAGRKELLTPEEYLEGELASDAKHEYVAGVVYAMAGAKNRHNEIALNALASLHAQLRAKPCRHSVALGVPARGDRRGAVTAYRRTDTGFVRESSEGLSAVVAFPAIGAELRLADVYEGIDLTEGTS